jgi:septum formation protein
MSRRIILASSSLRRKQLLKQAGFEFETIASDVEEVIDNQLALELAIEKLAYQKAYQVHQHHKDAIVIGADTIVVCENEVLNKPNSKEEAREMLLKLSGRTHFVITGVCIIDGLPFTFHELTKVTFISLTTDMIETYISTDEPYDKAGGYAIQGLAKDFIKEYSGDYENVVGLPLTKVVSYLQKLI